MASPSPFNAEYLYLTTIGRKTGLPREIEIWFVERAGLLYVLTEDRHRSQWFRNVMANPTVTVKIAGRKWTAKGRVVDPHADEALYREIQDLSRQKYGWGDGSPIELQLGQEN
jgi:deazaflavin-dependent oxidoreductase (nitroreductase family)